MHRTWIKWLEAISLECDILSLQLKRKKKLWEIIHQTYVYNREQTTLWKIKSRLEECRAEYEMIDLELALIDGRYHIIRDIKIVEKERSIEKQIKEMSLDDKLKLIKELEEMG